MSLHLIAQLVQLRYKLLWARTRTRNGKIAMFFVGYLLFVLIAGLLTAGGFGAATVAVRSGKAEMVARIVLTSLFVQSLMATVIMGFGMNALFSDLELRRYPMAAPDRLLTRHLVAIVDPFWFLGLMLEIGLAVGLYALDVGTFWHNLAAVVLLFITNYLLARVIGMFLERLMLRKSGSVILMAGVIGTAMALGTSGSLIKNNPWIKDAVMNVLAYTPPFGAAAAIVHWGFFSLHGFGLIVWWALGLAAALVAMERRPPVRQAAENTAISFDSRYERAASIFGLEYAPLVAHWLRFYMRNGRFKAMYVLTLPLVVFLTYNFGQRKGGATLFLAAMSTVPIITFMGPARFTVNQFGYVGGAFQRYFLLPADPEDILRSGNYASMLLGVPLIPVAGILWIALAPVPFDARQLFMLMGSAVTGMFVFHGLGLWSTLYGARRGNYNQSLGNDLSLLGNIVLIGGMMVFLFGTQVLAKLSPGLIVPAHWWLMLVPVALAVVFYMVSLRAAGGIFISKREQLMAVVEGRS